MLEKPIERLNFYNGEQLNARDLLDEQEYHIRVRRWLNKSLYSAGIAQGLEVRNEPGRKDAQGRPVIVVTPGLALDMDGQEIILVEEAEVTVKGEPNKVGETILGYYLYIQYHEEKRSEEAQHCAPRGKGRAKDQLAWGGPARVRATPILGWSKKFPHESSGKVVLAQVELDDKDCSVRNILKYHRRHIGPASNAAVHQYALEGERHIDKDNPGRIYFHIRGRQPNAVTLYLRAGMFSTLYYTEMGQHNHSIAVDDSKNGKTYSHHHSLPQINVPAAKLDKLDVKVWTETIEYTIKDPPIGPNGVNVVMLELEWWDEPNAKDRPYEKRSLTDAVSAEFENTEHGHTIPAGTIKTDDHTLSASLQDAGVIDPDASDPNPSNRHYSARGGDETNPPNPATNPVDPLKFVNDLKVFIGKVYSVSGELQTAQDYTQLILSRLRDAQPLVNWNKLGDGNPTHPLAKNGTGEIKLDLLSNSLSFQPGQYYIDLVVATGGGRILYNLYVE